MKRAETGPMQFGDDWPGVFIRGDNAAHFVHGLEHLLEWVDKQPVGDGELSPIMLEVVKGLRDTLAAPDVRKGINPMKMLPFDQAKANGAEFSESEIHAWNQWKAYLLGMPDDVDAATIRAVVDRIEAAVSRETGGQSTASSEPLCVKCGLPRSANLHDPQYDDDLRQHSFDPGK